MNSKVTVSVNKEGQVISRSPHNPDWGWIRLVQTRHILDEETGIMKTQFCSALVQGKIKDLEKLGWEEGHELEGKIIFKDSLTPYRKDNPEKDYKVAGKSGVVCSIDDNPIYRKYFYTPNRIAKDVFIQHDEKCREQIRKAYEEIEANNDNVLNPDFSL